MYMKMEFVKMTHPHGGVKSAGNFIVLLKTRTATQDLGKPELGNGTLHVANLALCGRRGLDPLGRLATDTTDHVGMCEGLWCPLLRLHIESGGNWLGDA